MIKRIVVSGHAFARMKERRIDTHQVEAAIKTPDLTHPARRGRLRAQKRFGHRVLHVFYKELPKVIVFVTAYWIKK